MRCAASHEFVEESLVGSIISCGVLRMPLHADHPCGTGVLDRLDGAVPVGAHDHQVVRQVIDRLVMEGVNEGLGCTHCERNT